MVVADCTKIFIFIAFGEGYLSLEKIFVSVDYILFSFYMKYI